MNQEELESNVIIVMIRNIIKSKFFVLFLVVIAILHVVNFTNSIYRSTCKLSPLFITEITSQIIEIDEIIKLGSTLEIDDLEAYSKNLKISAYVGGTSKEEKELFVYMNDYRQTAYEVIATNELSRKIKMSNYNDMKLVLMYELNSKRKSYSDLEILWESDVFELE